MRTPHRPPELTGQVFRGADAVSAGLLTRKQLRSSAWRPLLRGVYADALLAPGVGLQVRAAALLLPTDSAFRGRTAAWLWGVSSAVDDGDPVQVVVPADRRWGPVRGLDVARASLPAPDVGVLAGFRVTSPVRTAVDLARSMPPDIAVPILDPLLARTGLSMTRALAATGRADLRCGPDALLALCWADRRAESPPESHLRILLRRDGLRPVPQYVVRDARGVFLGRVDLAFPAHRLAIEYDGAWHAEPGQFARDRRRLNGLVAAGWRVLHVTAADLRDPAGLLARIHALLTPAAR